MTRLPVPLIDIETRPPEAGRIRLGVKSGKAMKSINTFRFTSPNRRIIDQLSGLYGGRVEEWNDPKANPSKQWQVISKINELPVFLYPSGLSCFYELWSGGGCQRRCDGTTCEIPRVTGDDYEMVDEPCLCVAENVMHCRPYTRLSLVIPSVEFAGVWRLDTKGWNAQKELPGMFEMIVQMSQSNRLIQAMLSVDQRERQTPTGKRNFVVPRLSIAQTAYELVGGTSAVAALGSGAAPEVVVQPALAPAPPIDDNIIEAEEMDDELMGLELELSSMADYFGLDPDRFNRAIRQQIGAGSTTSPEQRQRIRVAIERMKDGSLAALGFTPQGAIQWKG